MKLRSPAISIRLDENATAEQVPPEAQVMRVGTFYTAKGEKVDVTPELLKNLVKNFQEKVRGIDLAIDYKHDSDDIAAGWIKELYLMSEGKELWAKIDWTPKGRQILSDKEFRYLSADFNLDYRHNETNEKHGPTLLGAGLTNRPFIKEMEPVVTLSETKGNEMDPKDKEIADLKAQVADLQKKLDGAKPADASAEMSDMQKQNQELKEKVAGYEASAAKADQEKKLAEKKSTFDKLMSEGKAVEAQREHFMSGDTIKFAENAGRPNLSGTGSSQEPTAPVGSKEEAESQILKLAEKKLADKEVKTLSDGVHKVLHENKELAKRYSA